MKIIQNNFVKPQSRDYASYPSARVTCPHCTSKLEVDRDDVIMKTSSLGQRYWRFDCACCGKHASCRVVPGALLDTMLGIPVPGAHSW